MRALTVVPGKAGSVEVGEVPEPVAGEGELLVDGVALGICGTDHEIVGGLHGSAPEGADRLVLGHESLGRVRAAPPGSGFAPGDLGVGVVRRPDPQPCGACAHGDFDACRNGRFTERGIKERHGYGSERWTVEAEYAVRLAPELEEVGVLLEPASVVAKAWEQIERVGGHSWFDPRRLLVTGAGPIGLLAALFGLQRGLEVHVLDQVDSGVKPELVAALDATYHTGGLAEVAAKVNPEVVVEATGSPRLVLDAITTNAPFGVVCLVGLSSAGTRIPVDAGALNRSIVLENDAFFGSVNANLRHYELAARALSWADRTWLTRMITRRLPLERAHEAFRDGGADDVKVVVDL